MSSSTRINLFLTFIALLTFYIWEKSVFIETESQLFWVFLIHIGIIAISFASIKFELLSLKYNPILKGIIAVSFFFILFFIWNIVFRWYSDSFEYKGNIFRGILYGFRAPFYGRLKPKINLADYYPLYVSSALFVVLVFTIKWNRYSKWVFPALMIMGSLLFFSFAWDYSIHKTLMAKNCHYKTFSEGLSFFPEWSNFLSTYIGQMKFLGAHNNHYPPGVLLLLKLNNEFFPYLFKLIVISAPIISILPLRGILKHFSFSKESINIYIAFYISSIALLFFPGKSITPLHILFASSFIYFLLKSFHSRKIGYGVMAGLTLSVYAFFSFSFVVFALFAFIFIISLLLYKKIKVQDLVKSSLAIISTFVAVYVAINMLFDFNLYSCFTEAFHNEGSQMKSSGIDNITRYFIVSSGNLIAYIGIFAPLLLGIYAERINAGALNKNTSFDLLIKSVILTIVILSFSAQFYLEIERIWIFLTPFVLFGFLLYDPISKVKNLTYLRIALSLNICISIVYLIMTLKCT